MRACPRRLGQQDDLSPCVALLQFATRRANDEVEIDHWPWPARSLTYVLMFLAIVSSTSGEVEFIYFQF